RVPLRDAIRAAATERTWSQGVALARDRRVVGRQAPALPGRAASRSDAEGGSRGGDEIAVEVRVPGRPTPFEVVLNTRHEDWECTCTSNDRVCSHVVAAMLAVEQANGELPSADKTAASIRYLLTPVAGGVAIERLLVTGEQSLPLARSLMSVIAE